MTSPTVLHNQAYLMQGCFLRSILDRLQLPMNLKHLPVRPFFGRSLSRGLNAPTTHLPRTVGERAARCPADLITCTW